MSRFAIMLQLPNKNHGPFKSAKNRFLRLKIPIYVNISKGVSLLVFVYLMKIQCIEGDAHITKSKDVLRKLKPHAISTE